jgi:hypothetical protein
MARPPRRLALAALLAAPLLAGCAEDVAAPPAVNAAFTLWGALDPTADRQALRVVPVLPTVEPAPGPLDAVMTSTDLATGAQTTWADSLVTFGNGSTGHVFVAPFRAVYSGRYRVEVRRSDGATTQALVEVPPRVEAFLEADESGSPEEAVLWPGVPQLNAATLRLSVQNANCEFVNHDLPLRDVEGAAAEPFEFGWRTAFSLTRLREALPTELGAGALLQVTLRAEVASTDWRFPTEVFDPEILIEPGAFTNVEGGFGFVGAAYLATLRWEPDARATQRAGFQPAGFCNP